MKYDLIVVGAGVLGTFHAYHASKIGKKVLLLEKDLRQAGSSTQNFGQVVPSGMSKKWNKFGQRSIKTYMELQQKADFSIRQNGSVYIASSEDEHGLLEELSHIHMEFGYSNILLRKKGVLERFPAVNPDYIKSGLLYPQELSVDPHQMVFKICEYFNESGLVHVKFGKLVTSCTEKLSGCTISCSDGCQYEAEQLIVCCGYTFSVLYPELFLESDIKVSKLQMMKTAPITGIQLKSNILTGLTIRRYEAFEECPSFTEIPTPEHLIALKEKGIHILFKQADDGSIIIGDSHEYASVAEMHTLGLENNPEIDQLIFTEAQRIIALPESCIAERWSGFYGQHSDDIFVRDVDKHIRIITGIGGKGMTSSPGFAEESIRQLYGV